MGVFCDQCSACNLIWFSVVIVMSFYKAVIIPPLAPVVFAYVNGKKKKKGKREKQFRTS